MYLLDLIHDLKAAYKLKKEREIEKEDRNFQYDCSKMRLRPMGDMDGELLCVFIQVLQKYTKGLYIGFVRDNECIYGINMLGEFDDIHSLLHNSITYEGGTLQRYGGIMRRADNHKPLYQEEWEKSHPNQNKDDNDEYEAVIQGLIEDYYNQLENPIPYKLITADRVGADLMSCSKLTNNGFVVNKNQFSEIVEQIKKDNLYTDHKCGTYKRLLKEIRTYMLRDFNKKEIKQTLKYLKYLK